MSFAAGTFLTGLLACAGPADFAETYQAGLAKQQAGRYAEAGRERTPRPCRRRPGRRSRRPGPAEDICGSFLTAPRARGYW